MKTFSWHWILALRFFKLLSYTFSKWRIIVSMIFCYLKSLICFLNPLIDNFLSWVWEEMRNWKGKRKNARSHRIWTRVLRLTMHIPLTTEQPLSLQRKVKGRFLPLLLGGGSWAARDDSPHAGQQEEQGVPAPHRLLLGPEDDGRRRLVFVPDAISNSDQSLLSQ